MCGFVGEFAPQGGVSNSEIIWCMNQQMTHRGPDAKGLWREQNDRCVMAHCRLSIIDLSDQASQPMLSPDGRVVVAFNGEIYNHTELRKELEDLGCGPWKTSHADTEVVIHAYLQWGLKCFERFYGMFAAAIFDSRDNGKPAMHLVRDRLGGKPLYFCQDKGGWRFASEIRSLMAHPEAKAEMDLTAFWHYLTFIVTPAPLTMFRGIFKLPAGYMMTIDHQGKARAWQWWDNVPKAADTWSEKDLSLEEATEEFLRLMRQAVKRCMVADMPFGAMLSGGVDSSLTVALMSEMLDRPVTTFSIGYEGHDSYNEFHHAQRVAELFKTNHHTATINSAQVQDFLPQLVRWQDEPIADNVCIPMFFLAKLIASHQVPVALVGEGSDENFLGYWWCEHYRQKYLQVWQSPVVSWWKKLLRGCSPGLSDEDQQITARKQKGQELFWGGSVCWWGDLRSRLTPDPSPFAQTIDCPVENLLPPAVASLDSAAIPSMFLSKLSGTLAEPEVLQKITYMEMKLRMPEHLLMRVDKMTMAHSIEARVPFLDYEVIDFARRLPLSYKLNNGVGKLIIKKAAERYLPADIIYRKKQGFGAPMEEWFREEDFYRRCLQAVEKSPLFDQLLDKNYFGSLLKTQATSGGGWSFHLWTVLNALIWHAHWVERRDDIF